MGVVFPSLLRARRIARLRFPWALCRTSSSPLHVLAFPVRLREPGPGGSEAEAAAQRGSAGRCPLRTATPRRHGLDAEAQRVPPAESPGFGLFLARRRRGAEDEPGHPAGACVPGDGPPAGSATKGRARPQSRL